MNRMPELIAEYGDPLQLIDRIPRTVTELFYAWTQVPARQSMSRRHRNQRRWLARHLYQLSEKGVITRGVAIDHSRTYVTFWREALDADAPGRDQPAGAAHGNAAR